jgi:hypothetical protein
MRQQRFAAYPDNPPLFASLSSGVAFLRRDHCFFAVHRITPSNSNRSWARAQTPGLDRAQKIGVSAQKEKAAPEGGLSRKLRLCQAAPSFFTTP